MPVDGGGADPEAAGDLLGLQVGGHQSQALPFARCQEFHRSHGADLARFTA
jgi:hypothetical protein